MAARYFALVLGIVYIVLGIFGFFPSALWPVTLWAPDLAVETGYGYLFGTFPVNILNNIFYLLIGLWGVAVFRSYGGARYYAQAVAIIFATLAIIGFFPAFNIVFGLMPIFGNDIWLHAVTAVIAAYFGFFTPERAPARAR